MTVEITIHGPVSVLKGDYPVKEVKLATSFPVDGAQYSPSFRKGLWDGRKHLLNRTTGSFPTGLVDIVKETCEGLGFPVTVTDLRAPSPPKDGTFDLHGSSMTGKFAWQLDACQTMIEKKQGIIKVGTGGGKGNIAAAVIKYLGLKSLFIVTNRELLYQFSNRFKNLFQTDDSVVGIVGDGHWSPGSWITVATVDTLESRINEQYCQDLIKETEVLFIDEAHHVGSDTWYTVSILCPAMYRYGLSGTPLDRTDGANLRLIAATGSVIVDIPTKTLVDLKILAKADIVFDSITEPIQPKKSQYATVYKKAVVENPQLLQKVLDWTIAFHDEGLQTLILVEEIAQGKLIDDLLWTNANGRFLSHVFIHGSETTEVRQQALKDFADRKLPILIASTILDEGVDVPTIDTMILAGSRKSKIRTVQRLGRGLRGDCLIVVEFANYCHKYLIEHSMKRLEDYRGEQCFGIHKGTADRTLIRKLWDRQVKNRSV